MLAKQGLRLSRFSMSAIRGTKSSGWSTAEALIVAHAATTKPSPQPFQWRFSRRDLQALLEKIAARPIAA
jgi:hypothetical protein